MRKYFALALLVASFSVWSLADDRPTSSNSISTNDHGDPILKAMLAELKRSQEKLQFGQFQRPYFIDYQVTEVQDYSSDAILGAIRSDDMNVGRLVRVVVRIGDHKQDSYFGEGTGTVEVMPMDNNELALRHTLWLATDKAYKAALSGLTEKQAALKNVVIDQELPDFSEEKPVESVHSLAKIDADLDSWKKMLRTTSDMFRSDPDLESSAAGLHFRVLNRYYVNTEGSITRHGIGSYTYNFAGSTQAADGMRLERSHAYVVAKPDELPKPEEMKKDTVEMIGTFAKLRTAPLVEDDYHGPVLFSADAATALVERFIVPNILGIRPELGNPGRTRGEFSSYYKSRVLPEFFTIIDDPRSRKIQNMTLAGSYDVDDEGVEAHPVTVIEKGVLTHFLLGREPIRDFSTSNGHGRSWLAGQPRPQISNRIVKASNGVSFDELKQKLIQMCRDQGRPYGYYVETTVGPQVTPRLLWRIYVSDGHMELVRGAIFNQLDTRALRSDIVAAGNDEYVYNRDEPLPSAIVAPSMLFGDLEIQRANRTREKLPQYPAPPLANEQ